MTAIAELVADSVVRALDAISLANEHASSHINHARSFVVRDAGKAAYVFIGNEKAVDAVNDIIKEFLHANR